MKLQARPWQGDQALGRTVQETYKRGPHKGSKRPGERPRSAFKQRPDKGSKLRAEQPRDPIGEVLARAPSFGAGSPGHVQARSGQGIQSSRRTAQLKRQARSGQGKRSSVRTPQDIFQSKSDQGIRPSGGPSVPSSKVLAREPSFGATSPGEHTCLTIHQQAMTLQVPHFTSRYINSPGTSTHHASTMPQGPTAREPPFTTQALCLRASEPLGSSIASLLHAGTLIPDTSIASIPRNASGLARRQSTFTPRKHNALGFVTTCLWLHHHCLNSPYRQVMPFVPADHTFGLKSTASKHRTGRTCTRTGRSCHYSNNTPYEQIRPYESAGRAISLATTASIRRTCRSSPHKLATTRPTATPTAPFGRFNAFLKAVVEHGAIRPLL